MPFKKASSGSFYKPENGMYLAEFKGCTDDGPVFERTDEKTGVTSPNPQMRWHFALSTLSGVPVMDTDHIDQGSGLKVPTQADGEGLTSYATGVGRNGQKAKARQWLEIMCPLSPTTPGNFDETAEPDDEVARCIGAKVMVMYGNDTTGKPGKLLQVSPPPVGA